MGVGDGSLEYVETSVSDLDTLLLESFNNPADVNAAIRVIIIDEGVRPSIWMPILPSADTGDADEAGPSASAPGQEADSEDAGRS